MSSHRRLLDIALRSDVGDVSKHRGIPFYESRSQRHRRREITATAQFSHVEIGAPASMKTVSAARRAIIAAQNRQRLNFIADERKSFPRKWRERLRFSRAQHPGAKRERYSKR